DWHDIVLWRGLAEVSEKYLKKGYKVYVEGKLKKRSWQDKDGNTRYTTEVVADEMTILSRPESSDKNPEGQAPYTDQGTPTPPSKIQGLLDEDDNNLPF
ncbi:MAG: single-stranded DNA-binding protein, partial [Flavobacteriia bacterium]